MINFTVKLRKSNLYNMRLCQITEVNSAQLTGNLKPKWFYDWCFKIPAFAGRTGLIKKNTRKISPLAALRSEVRLFFRDLRSLELVNVTVKLRKSFLTHASLPS